MSQPGYQVINLTGSGDQTVIPAPTGANSFIRVYHYHFTSDRPTTVIIKSGTNIIDVCYATLASGGGISTPNGEPGVLACDNGSALIFNVNPQASVGGSISYSIKPGAF